MTPGKSIGSDPNEPAVVSYDYGVSMNQTRTVEYQSFRWMRLILVFSCLLGVNVVSYKLFHYAWESVSLHLNLSDIHLMQVIIPVSINLFDFVSGCGFNRMARFYADLVLFNVIVMIALNQIVILTINKYLNVYKTANKRHILALLLVVLKFLCLFIFFALLLRTVSVLGVECAGYADANVGKMLRLATLTASLSCLMASLVRSALVLGES